MAAQQQEEPLHHPDGRIRYPRLPDESDFVDDADERLCDEIHYYELLLKYGYATLLRILPDLSADDLEIIRYMHEKYIETR